MGSIPDRQADWHAEGGLVAGALRASQHIAYPRVARVGGAISNHACRIRNSSNTPAGMHGECPSSDFAVNQCLKSDLSVQPKHVTDVAANCSCARKYIRIYSRTDEAAPNGSSDFPHQYESFHSSSIQYNLSTGNMQLLSIASL